MAVTCRNKATAFLVVFFVLALPLQHLYDGISAAANIFSLVKVTSKTALPRHTDQVEFASVPGRKYETLNIPTSFFRVDYKQNLLLWPVVAGNITRSPPFLASL
jgi:hypothetical protein